MISKAQIKQIHSLQRQKGRKDAGLFVVEGIRAVEDILKSSLKVKAVYIQEDEGSGQYPVPGYESFEHVSAREMKLLSAMKTPPGLLAVVEIPQQQIQINVNKPFIILDGIKDPGNLGTIIRTAHWFGIMQILCSVDTVDVFNPKVVQATMGSVGFVDLVYHELQLFMKQHQNDCCFVGLDMKGETIHQSVETDHAIALVVGGEAFGIRDAAKIWLNHSRTVLPAHNQTNPDSLNAAIAASIGMFRFYG